MIGPDLREPQTPNLEKYYFEIVYACPKIDDCAESTNAFPQIVIIHNPKFLLKGEEAKKLALDEADENAPLCPVHLIVMETEIDHMDELKALPDTE